MQTWDDTLTEMKEIYSEGIDAAVRSQRFIKCAHKKLVEELESRLTPIAARDGVRVVPEARIHGSFKSKDVDVGVIHPMNGPLILIGVRSQMSSVGKNILTYTQDIMGEAVSLQDRFPMAVFGYAYLLPLKPPDTGQLDYVRYSRMFAGLTGRGRATYKQERGRYDHFAFMLVDFETDPPTLRTDLIKAIVPEPQLDVETLVDRCVETFRERNPWLDYFSG